MHTKRTVSLESVLFINMAWHKLNLELAQKETLYKVSNIYDWPNFKRFQNLYWFSYRQSKPRDSAVLHKGYCELETTVPGDFVTKVKQINSQSDLTSMLSFAGPSYLTIRSSVYIFNLRFLYFQSLQCLPNLILLHTLGTSPVCTSFQWINDRN